MNVQSEISCWTADACVTFHESMKFVDSWVFPQIQNLVLSNKSTHNQKKTLDCCL